MNKTTILYIRQASGGGGGADTMIANSISHLSPKHYSVILTYLRKQSENINNLYETLTENNIPYIDLPGGSIFDLGQIIKLVRIIKQHRIQVIHCHDPKCDLYGYILRFLFPDIKFVTTLHGWIIKRPKSKFYVALDKLIIRNFDAVIAVSDQICKTGNKHGIKNIHVIKNGIDIKNWQRTEMQISKSKTQIIGFAGRLSVEKGPLDFIRVAQKIISKNSLVEFHIAGTGPEEPAMKNLIKDFEIESYFHFAGHLDANQLQDFYQKLNIFMLTSFTEGIPLTLLEVGAMGVPVVATNVGGVSEIISHNKSGLLAPPGDIKLLTNHVLHLLSEEAEANKLALQGKSIIENNFSIKTNVEKLQTVYKNILAQT